MPRGRQDTISGLLWRLSDCRQSTLSATALPIPMASRRPLPTPPTPPLGFKYNQYTLSRPTDMYPPGNPYYSPYYSPDAYGEPTTTLPGGTLLHKGFYDLLSMIPTPSSPSRLLQQWTTQAPEPVVAGPRYEHIGSGPMPANSPPQSPPVSPKKGRRISKDMVSRPTGFVFVTLDRYCRINTHLYCYSHLVHASNADQAEALLTRWGPDGLGKLGGQASVLSTHQNAIKF